MAVKNLIWLGLLLALIAVAAIAMKGKEKPKNEKAERDLRPRRPLTEYEEKMFFRLRETFPQHIVLAQVAFSALPDTKQRSTRATFSQKVTDFVLCDRGLNVVAVIELDDSSHKNREEQDAKREELLTAAGYRVIRYGRIPEAAKLLEDFSPALNRKRAA